MKRFKNYCIWALIISLLASLIPEPQILHPPKLFLKLWFKTANKGLTQLYWNSSGSFSENDSEKSTIYAQNKFISQKYLLPDRYSELRFSPFRGSGNLEVKDITIVDIEDKFVRAIDIKKVSPVNQIDGFLVKDGVINAATSSNADNPMLSIEDSYSFPYPPLWEKYAVNIKTFLISFIVVVILGFLADFSDQARSQSLEIRDQKEEDKDNLEKTQNTQNG